MTTGSLSHPTRQEPHLLVHLLSRGPEASLERACQEEQPDNHPLRSDVHPLDHYFRQGLDLQAEQFRGSPSGSYHPAEDPRQAELRQPGHYPNLAAVLRPWNPGRC